MAEESTIDSIVRKTMERLSLVHGFSIRTPDGEVLRIIDDEGKYTSWLPGDDEWNKENVPDGS